ncbi:MAG: hypothetical protein SW833_02795 [Cyanobacteriota bacterium]|nr:hypothetical protein [Cyanobacteriota bacterium]
MKTQFIQFDHDHGFDLNKVVYWKMENERLWIYFVGLDEPLEFGGAMARMHYQLLKSRSVVYRPEPVNPER